MTVISDDVMRLRCDFQLNAQTSFYNVDYLTSASFVSALFKLHEGFLVSSYAFI